MACPGRGVLLPVLRARHGVLPGGRKAHRLVSGPQGPVQRCGGGHRLRFLDPGAKRRGPGADRAPEPGGTQGGRRHGPAAHEVLHLPGRRHHVRRRGPRGPCGLLHRAFRRHRARVCPCLRRPCGHHAGACGHGVLPQCRAQGLPLPRAAPVGQGARHQGPVIPSRQGGCRGGRLCGKRPSGHPPGQGGGACGCHQRGSACLPVLHPLLCAACPGRDGRRLPHRPVRLGLHPAHHDGRALARRHGRRRGGLCALLRS